MFIVSRQRIRICPGSSMSCPHHSLQVQPPYNDPRRKPDDGSHDHKRQEVREDVNESRHALHRKVVDRHES